MARKNPLPYLIDETQISERVGHQIPPLRVFTLDGLGIDARGFIDFMRPAFSVLHLDPYDAKRNKVALLKKRFPEETARLDRFLHAYYADHEDLDSILDIIARLDVDDICEFDRIGMTGRRKRAIARFILHRRDARWVIDRVSASRFQQRVAHNDPRSMNRVFPEVAEFLTDYPPMQKLMISLAKMVRLERPDATKLEITLHQMFIFADLAAAGDNAPEGTHQDGADFIVSAIVMERVGILGGESIIYGPDRKTEYLRRVLAPGEGIFQADRGSELWHYVTPIEENPFEPPAYGHRSIIGFDIDVVG